MKRDLGNVDDDTIRVAQREGAQIDLLVEVENESGLFGIAGDPDIGCDRERFGR